MQARLLAAAAISGYQRHLSPLKTWHCAYSVRHDTCSCSEFARRAVLRFGVVGLAVLLPKRFMRCREAFVALSEGEQQPKGKKDEGSAVADVATTAACALFEIASCL